MSAPITPEEMAGEIGKEIGYLSAALVVVVREIAKQSRIDSASLFTGIVEALTPPHGAQDHFQGLRSAFRSGIPQ
jgi:hypothetical protein